VWARNKLVGCVRLFGKCKICWSGKTLYGLYLFERAVRLVKLTM
jgi:hypothetical protein